MVFKKNNPGCSAGGLCGCVTRPCCSDVWDYVRADYSTFDLEMHGTTGDWAPSDPMTTSGNFVESFTFIGSTIYQCSISVGLEEEYFDHSPPPKPYRDWALEVAGQKYYAKSNLAIEVLSCLPSVELRVVATIEYCWIPDGNPATDITTAGYALDATWPFSDDRYYKSVGDFLHEVYVDPSPSYKCRIKVRYSKTLTSVADILTAIPNPLTLDPAYNPHPMSFVVTLS